MADFAKIAKEVFEVLQSFNYTVLLYSETGERTEEPQQARSFFDKDHNLGVWIVDDDDNSSINLRYGPSTHANDIMGLDQSLRSVATKSSLLFQVRQADKTIEPKDFPKVATMTERQKIRASLTEGMYGTSMSSYLRLENARMIVRHKRRIDDQMIGARGRCVESIFIENAAGERFLFPSTQLAPARAMTQHVNHGGSFGDDVGSQITEMANEYANLSHAAAFLGSHAVNLSEDAQPVREACRCKMRKMRKTFERLAKPSSYTVECNDMTEHAKTLKETGIAIDETRLTELRRLLNNSDLPGKVYETMCRAVDEMKEQMPPITEAKDDDDGLDYNPPPDKVERVLGVLVDRDAWTDFSRENKIELIQPPSGKSRPRPKGFTSRFGEVCYKLGELIPLVKNDSLQRLFQTVLDDLADYGEKPPFAKQQHSAGLKQLLRLAIRALKIARIPFEQDLRPPGAIRDWFEWLGHFHPDRVLMEADPYSDPYGRVGGMDAGDFYDRMLDDTVANFDAHEFVDSPDMQEVIEDRDPDDPEEGKLTRDDVLGALRSYLYRTSQTYAGGETVDPNMSDIAKQVYDQACEALQDKGFVVEDSKNQELPESARSALKEFLNGGMFLSREDILIPKMDQGDSMAREVTKSMVKDPDTKNEHPPDARYISRLQTLGWITSGPNGQSY